MNAGLLFAISLPGVVVLLVVLAAVERFGRKRGEAGPGPMTTAGVEELDGLLSAGKRIDIIERQSHSMMRDEEGDNAPPRAWSDVYGGVARVERPRRPGS